jgi:hypothetical protein
VAEQQEVRILTVRQPWAAAIIHNGKDVENRPRNIAGSYRGPVAIHAGLTIDRDAWDDLEAGWSLARGVPRIDGAGLDALKLRGVILGVVDLVDVHTAGTCWEREKRRLIEMHSSDRAAFDAIPDQGGGGLVGRLRFCSPWGQDEQQHLVLANPRPLATPIPYRGALGLRKLPSDIAAAVLAPPFPPIGTLVTRTTTTGGKARTTVPWEGQVTAHLKTKVRVRWDSQNGRRTVALLDHYPHDIQEATP